jgi:hypothetical protein
MEGGKREVPHRTFSLLPYQLVPYTKYSIPFIIETVKKRHIEGLSLYELQDYLSGFGEGDILSVSATLVLGFQALMTEAIEKIMASGYYQDFEGNQDTDKGRLISLLIFAEGFECAKSTHPIRGPCGLSYDFYLTGGSYFRNAPFLFGTPSQFR